MKTAQSKQSGFSLIELLLVIVMVGFIATLIFNLPQSLRLNGMSSHETLAKEIASEQIEKLRAKTYDNIGGNGTTSISDPRMSKLASGTGTITVADCPSSICSNNERIKHVTVTISWKDQDKTSSIKYDTLVAQGGLK